MPTPEQKKALDEGLLTKKQYDKLPSALLDGIIKSKRGGGKAKAKKSVPAPKAGGAGKSRNMGSTRKAKPSGPKNATSAPKKGKKK